MSGGPLLSPSLDTGQGGGLCLHTRRIPRGSQVQNGEAFGLFQETSGTRLLILGIFCLLAGRAWEGEVGNIMAGGTSILSSEWGWETCPGCFSCPLSCLAFLYFAFPFLPTLCLSFPRFPLSYLAMPSPFPCFSFPCLHFPSLALPSHHVLFLLFFTFPSLPFFSLPFLFLSFIQVNPLPCTLSCSTCTHVK